MASRCQPLDRPQTSRQANTRGPPAKRGTFSNMGPQQAATPHGDAHHARQAWAADPSTQGIFSIGEIMELGLQSSLGARRTLRSRTAQLCKTFPGPSLAPARSAEFRGTTQRNCLDWRPARRAVHNVLRRYARMYTHTYIHTYSGNRIPQLLVASGRINFHVRRPRTAEHYFI